jgi:hypothetical protein
MLTVAGKMVPAGIEAVVVLPMLTCFVILSRSALFVCIAFPPAALFACAAHDRSISEQTVVPIKHDWSIEPIGRATALGPACVKTRCGWGITKKQRRP